MTLDVTVFAVAAEGTYSGVAVVVVVGETGAADVTVYGVVGELPDAGAVLAVAKEGVFGDVHADGVVKEVIVAEDGAFLVAAEVFVTVANEV